MTEKNIHYLVDYLPMSKNKLDIIDDLTKAQGVTGIDKLEYYFPMIRFHSGWSGLSSASFDYKLNGLKGAVRYPDFLNTAFNVTKSFAVTDDRAAMTDAQKEVVEDLLLYCEEEHVRVLFVFVPQAIKDQEMLGQINTITDEAAARGFDVLNLQSHTDEIELDLKTDFYNVRHTNLHGCIKYMYYLGQYLRDHYDFVDKRGNEAYAGWDASAEKYMEIIRKYATDFELEHQPRDYGLEAPSLSISVKKKGITIKWSATDGAEEYLIYRKNTGNAAKPWELLDRAGADAVSYQDQTIKKNTKYYYTVVPVRRQDGIVVYGKFDAKGVNGKLQTQEITQEDS